MKNPWEDKIFREFMLGKYWWISWLHPKYQPKFWLVFSLFVAIIACLFIPWPAIAITVAVVLALALLFVLVFVHEEVID